jgi:bacteriorhodopsin
MVSKHSILLVLSTTRYTLHCILLLCPTDVHHMRDALSLLMRKQYCITALYTTTYVSTCRYVYYTVSNAYYIY